MGTIDSLDLSIRSYRSLKSAGITTIEALKNLEDDELKTIRHINHKAFAEIKAKLQELKA